MLGSGYIKKFIYISVFLVGFGLSSFASANAELSAHFGMKFGSKLNLNEVVTGDSWVDQNNRPFHLGADALYRQMMDGSSFGLGVRYRFAFTGEKDFEGTANTDDKYKFTHHRVALLLNYRFDMDQFFVGAVLGVDVWKSLMFSYMTTRTGTRDRTQDDETYVKSNQFLWNQITGQLGLELGYKVTPNFLVKLEAGYDLSSFGDLKCKRGSDESEEACGNSNFLVKEGTGEDAETRKLKLNAFYATLGIGWFFG